MFKQNRPARALSRESKPWIRLTCRSRRCVQSDLQATDSKVRTLVKIAVPKPLRFGGPKRAVRCRRPHHLIGTIPKADSMPELVLQGIIHYDL